MKTGYGGRAEHKKAEKLTQEIAGIAEIPGALDMMVTMAAEKLGGPKGGKTKQLRLYNRGGAVQKAEGGLAQAAEMTRGGGRGDDEMLLHLAPEEYEAITAMWGQPETNPNTGLPEYGFLSKVWKKVKGVVKKIVKSPLFSFVAPIALNIFAPGLGAALGGMLGATGKTAAAIGNTLVRGGIGAVSGGKDGAISGVLSGLTSSGIGSKIGSKLGLGDKIGKIAGDALLGGAAGEATGVGFKQGATGQAMQSLAGNQAQKFEDRLTGMGRDAFGRGIVSGDDPLGSMSIDPNSQDPFGYGSELLPQTSAGNPGDISGLVGGSPAGAILSGATSQAAPGFLERVGGWMGEHPWLTAGGALLAGSALSGGRSGDSGGGPPQLPDSFTTSLPNLSFDRTAMPIQDYYNYGRASAENPGEAMFFQGNSINGQQPSPTPPGVVPGGGGRRGRGGGGRGVGNILTPTSFASSPTEDEYGILSMDSERGQGIYGNMFAELQAKIRAKYGMEDPVGGVGVYAQPLAGGMEGGYVGGYKLGGLVRKYAKGGVVAKVAKKGAFNAKIRKLEQLQKDGKKGTEAWSKALKEAQDANPEPRTPIGFYLDKYQSGGHVRGEGTGRSDEIPAVLSDGEYVIDSESVALLGDGSTDAGAKRLDEMRKKLRQHKGKKLSKGGFSDAAKTPEQYMAEGGEVAKKTSTSALRSLKQLAHRLEQAVTSGNKKRVSEITSQLKSLDGGDKILSGFAKGGTVSAVLRTIERQVNDPDVTGVTGPLERKAKDRRKKARDESGGRRKGKDLTDDEKAELARELGGYPKNSKFIRNLKRDMKKAKETS